MKQIWMGKGYHRRIWHIVKIDGRPAIMKMKDIADAVVRYRRYQKKKSK